MYTRKLKEADKKMDRYTAFETRPEAGSYYRSDHFNFARVGIPALCISNGVGVIGKDTAYGKKVAAEYNEKHYHRPSDEWNKDWNLDGAVKDLQLLFMVGKGLASGEKWPEWKSGSEFKPVRDRTLGK